MKKEIKHRFWTKGKKTTISGLILGLFTLVLIWTGKCGIYESIPFIAISLILLGVKDDFMKGASIRIFIGLILLGLFSSCITAKKCNRLYPPSITIKDSIIEKEKLVIRDTIIYRDLPKDTVKIEKIVYIKNGIVNMPETTAQNGIVSALARIINNKLSVMGWINDSTIFFELKGAITERDKYKEIISQTTITPPAIEINKLTQWQIFQMWLGRILLIITIVYFGFKLVKKYFLR